MLYVIATIRFILGTFEVVLLKNYNSKCIFIWHARFTMIVKPSPNASLRNRSSVNVVIYRLQATSDFIITSARRFDLTNPTYRSNWNKLNRNIRRVASAAFVRSNANIRPTNRTSQKSDLRRRSKVLGKHSLLPSDYKTAENIPQWLFSFQKVFFGVIFLLDSW